MKIVVADGYALNPGDISWDSIFALGELVVYDRTPVELLVERCIDADVILTNKTPVPKAALDKLPNLKLISVLATGYNIVDIDAAKQNNVVVCNVPGYAVVSAAQYTFALLLALTNHVDLHNASVKAGEWVACKDFSYSKAPIIELAGKTLGIVGLGSIGVQVANIAETFGMKIIYNNRHKKDNAGNAEYVTMQQLFAQSDVVSLHCPLQPENTGFVNNSLLSLMKPTAFLINTARGQLVNEQHLADVLNNNVIAGAALDVLSAEPPPSGNPLLSAKNCIITPHLAWNTKEARLRVMHTTMQNIQAFSEGKPQNVVGRQTSQYSTFNILQRNPLGSTQCSCDNSLLRN